MVQAVVSTSQSCGVQIPICPHGAWRNPARCLCLIVDSRPAEVAGRPGGTISVDAGHATVLQGTTTETGLTVCAALHDGVYQTGKRVSDAKMASLTLGRHAVCPT